MERATHVHMRSRNRFSDLRASLRFTSDTGQYSTPQNKQDPLWYRRTIIEEIEKKIQSLAVPRCASAFDEN